MADSFTNKSAADDERPSPIYPPFRSCPLSQTSSILKLTPLRGALYHYFHEGLNYSNIYDARNRQRPVSLSKVALLHNIAPLVKHSSEYEEAWMQTYVDVITLLLTMFVVMMALSDSPGSMTDEAQIIPGAAETLIKSDFSPVVQAPTPPQNSFRETLAPILKKWREEGRMDDISVTYKKEKIELQLSSHVLFPSGQAQFISQGLTATALVADLLLTSDFMVTVEGHTDNVPIASEEYASNWELSTARASAVVRRMIELGIPATRLRAVGYADTRPIADNNSEEGRRSNRRVVFVLEKNKI